MLVKLALGIALAVATAVLWRFAIDNFRRGQAPFPFKKVYRRDQQPLRFWFQIFVYAVWLFILGGGAITTLSSIFI